MEPSDKTEPLLSDDEEIAKNGPFVNLGKAFKRVAASVARTAASASEMLKDEELRKKGANLLAERARTLQQGLQKNADRVASTFQQAPKSLQGALDNLQRKIHEIRLQARLEAAKDTQVDVQVGVDLYKRIPQVWRSRLWYAILSNPAITAGFNDITETHRVIIRTRLLSSRRQRLSTGGSASITAAQSPRSSLGPSSARDDYLLLSRSSNQTEGQNLGRKSGDNLRPTEESAGSPLKLHTENQLDSISTWLEQCSLNQDATSTAVAREELALNGSATGGTAATVAERAHGSLERTEQQHNAASQVESSRAGEENTSVLAEGVAPIEQPTHTRRVSGLSRAASEGVSLLTDLVEQDNAETEAAGGSDTESRIEPADVRSNASNTEPGELGEWEVIQGEGSFPDMQGRWLLLQTAGQTVAWTSEVKEFQEVLEAAVDAIEWPVSTETDPSGRYSTLLQITTGQEEIDEVISRDIHRTFPEHPQFGFEQGQQELYRVLKAYSVHDLEVGYCQGMAFIAGILLMYLTEEAAFKTLAKLFSPAGPNLRRLYLPDMEGLKRELRKFEWLMHKFLPGLQKHLEAHSAVSVLYAAQWFLTGFTCPFPAHFALRITDIMLLEDTDHIMQRTAMAVMADCAPDLLELDDFEEIITFLKTQLAGWTLKRARKVLNAAFMSPITDEILGMAEKAADCGFGRSLSRQSTNVFTVDDSVPSSVRDILSHDSMLDQTASDGSTTEGGLARYPSVVRNTSFVSGTDKEMEYIRMVMEMDGLWSAGSMGSHRGASSTEPVDVFKDDLGLNRSNSAAPRTPFEDVLTEETSMETKSRLGPKSVIGAEAAGQESVFEDPFAAVLAVEERGSSNNKPAEEQLTSVSH